MPPDVGQLLVVQRSWTALIDRARHSTGRSDHRCLRRQTAVDGLRVLRDVTREVVMLENA